MKFKLLAIFLLFSVSSNNLWSQTKEFDDVRANAFYKVNKRVQYGDKTEKKDYKIALYGFTNQFKAALEKQKPNSIITGEVYRIEQVNSIDKLIEYDIIIIDESKNADFELIYSKAQKAALGGAAILIVTNNYSDKTKILINFSYLPSTLEPNVEYYLPNCAKLNLTIDENNLKKDFKNIIDIKIENELEQKRKELDQKTKDLSEKIAEIKNAEIRIDEQKRIVDNQQKTIEDKQKEIEIQQAHLKELSNQMLQTKIILEKQQRDFQIKERELFEKQQAIIEFQNKIEMMQTQFAKQKEIIEKQKLEVEKFNKQVEEKKKELGNLTNIVRLQRYALAVFGFLLVIIIVLTIWILRNYRKMKEQNNILEQQKNEIMTQAEELEKANIELEKLSIVASQTRNAVAILSSEGRFEWINAGFTKLYGYTLQLLSDELDSNIFNNSIYLGIEQKLKQAIESKESFTFEHQATTRNNNKIWIHSSITPIINYENKLKQIVIVDSDITEIKVAEQKIAQQNKDIKKSITYASRIQNATLPSDSTIKKYLKESFVLFLPRDIVSGDFYWIYNLDDKIFFAAADCTGHGVPGAFMSMLGTTLLNETLSTLSQKPQMLHPNFILDFLREKVIQSLRQSENETSSKDGIAISMCMFAQGGDVVEFAGAENPMIIVRDGQVLTYDADDMSIGVGFKQNDNFKNNIINVQKNDMIYLFSDGYVDQFGGPKRKKFLIARLRELFSTIYNKPTDEQKQILYKTHIEWKGQSDQIDDIIIFGVRIS